MPHARDARLSTTGSNAAAERAVDVAYAGVCRSTLRQDLRSRFRHQRPSVAAGSGRQSTRYARRRHDARKHRRWRRNRVHDGRVGSAGHGTTHARPESERKPRALRRLSPLPILPQRHQNRATRSPPVCGRYRKKTDVHPSAPPVLTLSFSRHPRRRPVRGKAVSLPSPFPFVFRTIAGVKMSGKHHRLSAPIRLVFRTRASCRYVRKTKAHSRRDRASAGHRSVEERHTEPG